MAINVSRNDREITFSAGNAHDLATLYEQLEQGDIAFTCRFGGPNEITACLSQGDDVDALDKELHLDFIASEYDSADDEEEDE